MSLFASKKIAEPFSYVNEWNKKLSETGWWHSFELPDGTFIEGVCDINGLRERLSKFPIPDDLHGKRVLDIGTWDGWYAFEMEKRGADVTAVDCWRNPRFIEMRGMLNSRVEYLTSNVYDLTPERVGKFDIVLFLGVLYHLKHPLLALERVCALTKEFAAVDSFVLRDHHLSGADKNCIIAFYETDELGGQTDNWVGPSVSALEALCRTAGFARAEFRGYTEYSGCFVCYRQWENPQGTNDVAPELASAFHHTNFGINFIRSTEEYVTIWFKHPARIMKLDDVKPSVFGYGVRPMAVHQVEPGVWQSNFMLPPGLRPGWHEVTLRVANSAASNPIEIAVDLPAESASLRIAGLADGKEWTPGQLDLRLGSTIAVWVEGLPDNADGNLTKAFVNGQPARVIFVQGREAGNARQVNLEVPRTCRGNVQVTVGVGSITSDPEPCLVKGE